MIRICKKCALHKTRKRIVAGFGSLPADVLFIDDFPRDTDELTGTLNSGPTGILFDRLLAEVGIESFRIESVLACRVPFGQDIEPAMVLSCSDRFLRITSKVKPKVIAFLNKDVKRWYRKEFLNAKSIIHPEIIVRSGGLRSPNLILFRRQLIEVKEAISA